jgi:predicted ATPase/DNA-binding SARP family transcriptional activator
MEVAVLGPLQLTVGGTRVDVPGRRERTLLALLLLQRNGGVSAASLTAELFGADAPSTAVNGLRVHVSRLRRALAVGGADPVCLLQTRAVGYSLPVADDDYDAAVFEAAVTAARTRLAADPAAVAEALRSALRLWRGTAYADADAAPSVAAEAARLEELRLGALEDRVDADGACGRHRVLASELEALVRAHPLRERLWAAWVLALYRCGRQADALAACRQVRRLLADEVGVEPGAGLRRVERAVRIQDPGLDWAPADAAPAAARRHNLPVQLTSFVGRVAELEAISGLLRDNRLLTLTGTGGCGKTRLAVQVARRVAGEHADGVRFVDWAAVRHPEELPVELARSWDLVDEPFRTTRETVLHHLEDKRVLVVLDNCEHVLDAAAEQAAELLRRCPWLTLLATSREALGITGEVTWRVPSMSVPPARAPLGRGGRGSEAVQLFADRARRVRPEFELTDANTAAVMRTCRRLDGIPLAIELAAACIASLTPHDIDEGLRDRFTLLTRGPRDASVRHQTLRASVQWSVDLLPADERTAFRRLSVFAGGLTVDAARAIGVERVLLERLVATSLLVVEDAGQGSRFRLLETLRSFGQEELEAGGEADEVRRRHREYFLAWAEEAARAVRGPAHDDALDALVRERGNLRTAFRWSLERGDEEAALRLASALEGVWLHRSRYVEGRDWFDAVLPGSDGVAPVVLARALTVGARVEGMLFGTTALPKARQAGVLIDPVTEPAQAAAALTAAGMAQVYDGERAAPYLQQAVDLARRAGDPVVLADALAGLALSAFLAGDAQAARPVAEEGLTIAQALGHRHLARTLGFVLGSSLMVQGELAAALTQLHGVEVESGRAGDAQFELSALLSGSMIQSITGRPAEGLDSARSALAIARRTGVAEYEGHCFVLLGYAGLAAGDVQAAQAAFKRSADLVTFLPSVRALTAWGLTIAALATDDVEGASRHATEMATCFPTDSGSWYAAAGRLAVAQVALAAGDWSGAAAAARTALVRMRVTRMGIFVADALEVQGAALHLGGRHGDATVCLGAAEAHRAATGEVRLTVCDPRQEALVSDLRSSLSHRDFRAAWDRGAGASPNGAPVGAASQASA